MLKQFADVFGSTQRAAQRKVNGLHDASVLAFWNRTLNCHRAIVFGAFTGLGSSFGFVKRVQAATRPARRKQSVNFCCIRNKLSC